MPYTTADLITDVFYELGYIAPGESQQDVDVQFVLGKINRLLDNWNADRMAVYAEVFTTYVLTASLQPHTIGPSGQTFTATQRPVAIDGATLILTDVTPNVRNPITIRDADWWRRISVQALTSPIPTDLYYDTAWPNGSIYLWPKPTTAYSIELQTRVVLAALALTDTFTMPPGYRDAVTLTVAEESASGLGVAIPVDVPGRALACRARIFPNNVTVPKIQTRDAGMPGGGEGGSFNYLTRQGR